MSSEDETNHIECCRHGERIAAIVCCHMIESEETAVGFVENSSDPEDLQAWCSACESMFLSEGDKTERFRRFNDFAVVCDLCYAALKEKHEGGKP